MIRTLTLLAVTVLIVVQTACVPRTRGDSMTIDAREDPRGVEPPVLPQGEVTPGVMADAIRFDLTNRPDDQDYWTLSDDEAECAADGIIAAIGADRLTELGYQPGVAGSGLPQIALTTAEREDVTAKLVDCVDLEEMAAALLFGAGRISPGSATCMARILAKAGVPAAWLESWVTGADMDPLADDAALSRTMSSAAEVCLDPNDLNWPTLRSPVEDELVIDADAPAGSSNSNHPDDHRDDGRRDDGDDADNDGGKR